MATRVVTKPDTFAQPQPAACLGGDCHADHRGDERYEQARRAELLAKAQARRQAA